MTVTVTKAVSDLRVRLDEPTARQWQDTDLRQWLNEGIRDIARQTRLYTDQTTIAVAANLGEVSAPPTVLAIEHLIWKATADVRKIPLEARAFRGVNRYINDTGSDVVFYSTYGHPPTLKIQLWPTPTRAGTLYFYGPMLPLALDVTGGTGNIDVMEGWYEAALDYAMYMAMLKDKDPSWKDIFQLYQSKVQTMIELANTDDAAGEFTFTGTSIVPSWLSDFD